MTSEPTAETDQSDRNVSDARVLGVRSADARPASAHPPEGFAGVGDRYGTRPRWTNNRWVPYTLGAGVIVLGLIIAYVGYRQFGPKDIDPDQLGYTLIDNSTVDVHFKVTRTHPDRPAVCFVRAMDTDGTEVGRREVLIPATGSGTLELHTTVRSTARPANGNIYGCSADVPAYLRAD